MFEIAGGNKNDTKAVMDTGCTFSVTTTAVTKGIKAEIMSLKEELDIIQALGKSLEVIGTSKMFIEKKL